MKEKALRKSKLYLRRASPTILTCLAAIGVVVTSVMAVKATPKAMKLLDEAEEEKGEKLPKTEIIRAVVPAYIPSVVIGASTIACIFGANILNRKQQAALTSAYALIDSSYKEYRSKLRELYGEETHNAIIDSIAKEKCSDICITCPGILETSTLDFGDSMEPEITRTFYDSFSQRYFESSISKVIQAEYHLNRNFMFSGVIALNDFYEFLGLAKTEFGNTVGWSSYNGDICWIDFNHHRVTLDDGMEIFIIDMVFEPTVEWLDDI